MGAVVVLGEQALVGGYALAGAVVMPAEGTAQTRQAWQNLPSDTTLVILTVAAARSLREEIRHADSLIAVMPL